MIKISDESYERVKDILYDIGFACDTEDDYDQWEDIARPSFETFLDELNTEQFDMTCAAVKERIIDEYDSGKENYAKGIRAAFIGYLKDRREFWITQESTIRRSFPKILTRTIRDTMMKKWRHTPRRKPTLIPLRSG